jgi:tetratricopeptide (TPR) repeat protein
VCTKALERYADARELLEKTLKGRDQVLGKDHSDTIGTVCELAKTVQLLKQYEEAKGLYERALVSSEGAVGYGEGLECLSVAHSYGQLYVEMGQYEAAKGVYERALKGQAGATGGGTMGSLKMLICLGNIHLRLGLLDAAHANYTAVIKAHDALNVRNWDHPLLPDYFIACYNLAGLLVKREDKGEAKKLYQRVVHGYAKLYGATFADTVDVQKKLDALS